MDSFLFPGATILRPRFRHVKTVFAEPAVPWDLADCPHYRIAPAAGQGRDDILTEAARTTQLAWADIQLLMNHHLWCESIRNP